MRPARRHLELAAIIGVTALAAWLRFTNLETNPAWYTDEGTHLDIARNLIAGRVQYLAIDQSLLIFSRLPLFENLLAVWLRLTGVSMLALRAATAGLGTLTVVVLWAVCRRALRARVLALLAALLLAVYPSAVLYSRFGFSYNLLAPLLLIAMSGLIEYSRDPHQRRWLAVACGSIGLSCLTDLWAVTLFVPFVIIVLIRNWRDLIWSVPLALLPLGLYLAVNAITIPTVLAFDLNFVRSRLATGSASWDLLLQNALTVSTRDIWLPIGFVGLLILRRWRWLVVVFLIGPFIVLGRSVPLFSLSFYYVIPLLPLLALGVANLIWAMVSAARDRLLSREPINDLPELSAALMDLRGGLMVGAFCLALIVWQFSSFSTLRLQVQLGFRTDIDPFLIEAAAAQQAAAFVNERVSGDDLVIASPAIAWQIRSNVADFQMSIASGGQATPHLPANVPADHWAFDPTYQRARFVIVDNLWRNWAVPDVPGVREMLIEVETWPLALKTGEIDVYANPR